MHARSSPLFGIFSLLRVLDITKADSYIKFFSSILISNVMKLERDRNIFFYVFDLKFK